MPLLKQTMPRLALVFIAAVVFSTAARAIPQTFVSSSGSDANTCERTAPCKTFTGALAKTTVKGEIVVLDAGEYGTVTINKSVTITAEGLYAGITAAGGAAVSIEAAQSAVIVLRGLTIRGNGALYGIHHVAGGVVHVENCVISNLSSSGIKIDASGHYLIKDTIIRNNSNAGIIAQLVGSSVLTASIDHCRLENNGTGLYVISTEDAISKITVRDSVAAYNSNKGFQVDQPNTHLNVFNSSAVNNRGAAGFQSHGAKMNVYNSTSTGQYYGFLATAGGILSVKDCTASGNTFGVSAQGATKVSVDGCQLTNNASTGLQVTESGEAIISDSLVTGNRTGLKNEPANPGTLETFGNNRVRKNTVADVIGTITPVPQT